MDISSEIVYFLDENNNIIKYHKYVVPFCWVYINNPSQEYEDYLKWIDEGNTAELWSPEELNGN